jgi:hypothetical protein
VADADDQTLIKSTSEGDTPSWLRPDAWRLTNTGERWALFPWYFLIRKRLTFTILELMVWITAWGGSSGALASTMTKHGYRWPLIAVLLYGLAHAHCMAFTGTRYQYRFDVKRSYSRTVSVLIPQLLFFGAMTAISLVK